VKKSLLHNKNLWVGIRDINENGKWTWIDETDIRKGDDSPWFFGEPNNAKGNEYCAYSKAYEAQDMNYYSGRLVDAACQIHIYFIFGQNVFMKFMSV